MFFADPLSCSLPSTIWYELHAREWPYKSQPAEAIIWQIGSGMKPNLTQTGMGKEISVSPLTSSFKSNLTQWRDGMCWEVLRMRPACNADSVEQGCVTQSSRDAIQLCFPTYHVDNSFPLALICLWGQKTWLDCGPWGPGYHTPGLEEDDKWTRRYLIKKKHDSV